MLKINGYTEEEARALVEYIEQGKSEGKTLSALFKTFGEAHGRAKGSVRNYYYTLLKSTEREEVREILEGTTLRAEDVREFTEEETDRVLREILTEKSKGFSVRRAIRNLVGENEKLMLRYQNKYRNVLKKEPERLLQLEKELGIESEPRADVLRRRVEEEINSLYDRIARGLKEENERLRKENGLLIERIDQLEAEIACLKGGSFTHTESGR
ncbi:MAG: hypothetical protein ACI4U2_01705 [Christensenellaceae bacterium]